MNRKCSKKSLLLRKLRRGIFSFYGICPPFFFIYSKQIRKFAGIWKHIYFGRFPRCTDFVCRFVKCITIKYSSR